jgi:acetyl-CoA carboxylase biotin carboxyl carrier protein
MDLKEIQALIKFVAKSGAQEVSLETEDFKINIKTGPDASDQPTYVQAVAPQQMPAAAPAATSLEAAPAAPTAPAEVDDSDNYITIKSPMIGTFYRTPSPDQDAFVKIGVRRPHDDEGPGRGTRVQHQGLRARRAATGANRAD